MGGKTEDDEKWFNMMDLKVEEINRNLISLGESYIQVRSEFSSTQQPSLLVEELATTDICTDPIILCLWPILLDMGKKNTNWDS